MDLSPGQRKAAFAVIVLALAGLGIFLLSPKSPSAPARPQAGAAQPAASTPVRSPVSAAPAAAPSTSAPSGGGSPGGPVDIYQWLPFSRAALASAAATVRSFAAGYATYTYRQSAASYVAPIKGLITSQLAASLARGYAAPGVAQQRTSQKQSASGSGQITAIRSFGTSSITFLVTLNQRTTGSQGTARLATGYAVTVTAAGTNWQVSDIELATAGNS